MHAHLFSFIGLNLNKVPSLCGEWRNIKTIKNKKKRNTSPELSRFRSVLSLEEKKNLKSSKIKT